MECRIVACVLARAETPNDSLLAVGAAADRRCSGIRPAASARRRAARRPPDASARLELYRSRVAALEEQHRIGALSESDLGEARDELGRELLEDEPRDATPARGGGSRTWLAIAVGVGVPVLAIGLYQHLGAPRALHADSLPASVDAGQRSVQEMVAGLAARLQAQPDDSGGWLLLGRSYMVLERYAEAFEAYSNAHRLLGDSPALLTDMAEAAALANGQDFLGLPGELLERALALDPAFPKALWLGAFAARQRGDTALAVSRWRILLDGQPQDSEAARVLQSLIADNGGAAGGAPSAQSEPRNEPPAPSLVVDVAIDDSLAAGLDGSEALYVFARASDGPPMPLAVTRALAGDLPLTVTLDDSMAMAGGRRLSDAGRVIVGARIAVSGTPTRSSGDLQGFSAPVPVAGDQTVRVVIDERVP